MLKQVYPLAKLTIQIPFAYAGIKWSNAQKENPDLTISHDQRVTLDGHLYTVREGYLVPFYEPEEANLTRRNEELVMDRANRFFAEAEPELDVRLTHNELVQDSFEYESCTIPALRKIKARFLVGAMVNRMERLERAILQKNIEGIPIEINPESGTSILSDAEIKTLTSEFTEYYTYLVTDRNNDPIHWVRLRNMAPDHDGILLDLVREMGKTLAMQEHEQMLRGGILTKIGRTMGAIDETHDAITRLLDNKHVEKAIDRACIKALPIVHGANDEEVKIRGSVRYRAMFEELSSLCRARVGLKTQDRPNFGAVRERIAYLDAQLHDVNKQVGELRRLLKGKEALEVVDMEQMLRTGVKLMHDMSALRIPKNQHAPAIYAQGKISIPDASSVGRLTYKVDRWLTRQETPHIS